MAFPNLASCVLLLTATGLVWGQTVNEGPQWEETLITKLQVEGIHENHAVGSELGYIRARDPEGGEIRYSADGSTFSVDSVTGMVTLASALDREATSQIRATFYARDPIGNMATVTYSVTVLDVNDASPVFHNIPYSAVISESAPVGSVVFSGISVTDRDRGRNAAIRLLCGTPAGDEEARQACQMFEISPRYLGEGRYQGIVTLAGTLNHELKRKYILTIVAEDEGIPTRSSSVNLAIDVRDAQDSSPSFLTTSSAITLFENAAPGTEVTVIRVRDGDGGTSNPIRLTIQDDPRNLFTLDSIVREGNTYSAALRTTQTLNAATLGGNYQITVRATEMLEGADGAYSDMTFTVSLRDVNDNPPSFNKQVYDINIPENLPRGQFIPNLDILVSDTDTFQNSDFRLEITKDPYQAFSLSPTSGRGSASIQVRVERPEYLDYEVAEYRKHIFELVAIEEQTVEQRSSTATIILNLYDVNDNNPIFDQRRYDFSVREDRQLGYLVGQVQATDKDAGHFGQIRYSIIGSNVFRIDPSTGEIFIRDQLDYERTREHIFTVRAMDGGESKFDSTEVHIQVTNSNDQGPIFEVDRYETTVVEGEIILTPRVTVVATDPESRSRVSYRIIRGNTRNNDFTIGQYTGLVELRRPVQYEETPGGRGYFELIVQASDNENPPQTANIPVIVNVRDLNNNAPVFQQNSYFKTIQETDPPGTSIVTVSATDTDTGTNAEVRYLLASGHRDNFLINYVTGFIQVASGADLDIDRNGNSYTIIVHAVDRGSPPRTGTAQVVVQVTDGNNKPPRFQQNTYLMSVLEDVPVRTSVGNVQAVDPDQGARIEYFINSGSFSARNRNGQPVFSTSNWDYRRAFTIDRNTGEIRSDLLFNREYVAEVTFEVTARDVSVQDQNQVASAQVIVTIQGSSDGQVEFNPPWTAENPIITINMPEEQPRDTIVTTVAATDPDSGRPVQNFREVQGSDPNGYFRVERRTGQVYLTGRLDYENLPTKRVSFQLEAFTSGPRVKSAMATIIVIVEDINDNSPVFQQNDYTFSFSESTRPPAQIGIVVATDADSGDYGRIYYSISGQGENLFRIDENGYIYLANGATVDRELKGEYYLLLNAEDNQGGSGIQQKTSIPLVFRILDENDNNPQFIRSEYDLYTLETIRAQTSLGRVQATDPDDGDNGRIIYSITSGDTSLFSIDENSGVIFNRRDLQGYAKVLPYVLTVEAQDAGPQSQGATARVNIMVDDLQFILDGRPRFLEPERDNMYIPVQEEVSVGTNIVQVIAQDDDPGPAGVVVYSFLDNDDLPDHDFFTIDPVTGWISTNRRLDREQKQIYTLILVARDRDSPPNQSTRTLLVNLTDINDNDPTFQDCNIGQVDGILPTSVKEEQIPPQFITQIYACDPDGGDNNRMFYYITCGNDPVNETSSPPFAINRTDGTLITQVKLDRESTAKYQICVKVSNNPNYTITEDDRNPNNQDGNVLIVDINVDDIDDNGPIWGGGGGGGGGSGGIGGGGGSGGIGGIGDNTLVAGVSATAPYGSPVARIFVIDRDGEGTSNNRFSIEGIQFHRNDGAIVSRGLTFEIDEESGIITTNLPNYMDFRDGYFNVSVQVTDGEGRTAEGHVTIYVLIENRRLKYVFNTNPAEVYSWRDTFLGDVSNNLDGAAINVDDVQYHVTSAGVHSRDQTDMCFHVVKDNQIMHTADALALFKKKEDELEDTYTRYKVEDIELCEVRITTRWWDGWWWLWWLLIALAILIFILAFILIIVLCCCWYRYRDYAKIAKPYVVLDPIDIPINKEYEWQETTVKMD